MDALTWAEDAALALEREFGDRLSFVGLQGSRARGEAREDSDIDLVVLLDGITADDLGRCRAVIQKMPRKELACGFVGSTRAIASWPRHELFQFAHDTRPVHGDLSSIIDARFVPDDALCAARIGASGIYHALCHTRVFGDDEQTILEPLFKQAFFVLQALQFARTGRYPETKRDLAKHLAGEEALILEVGRDWEAHRPAGVKGAEKLTDLLLRWSESVMASTSPSNPERERPSTLKPFEAPPTPQAHVRHPSFPG
ncbi:hypothetical protein B5F40_08540 [Gordonibacter sp. An230]|uniref:nucleotidyltransferase family protein n=1 Tax=Gordonibacter sp. An230 TaxID=1965592 RepID=UPI000B389BAC|nr:nucleotidyltransferase domain-containing protein [Gordonibacter sp. An230]OUO90057.1 hypothetical protein B5F40_08540 [Gordonibacter sp. An230]